MRSLRKPIPVLVVGVLLANAVPIAWGSSHPARGSSPWRESIESAGAPEPALLGFDACGCGRALRACLIAASVNLGHCLAAARTPVREAICYFKFELDAVLCLERAVTCQLTCVP